MFYFNTHSRVTYYPHFQSAENGYDHCYDCRAEIFVLQKYFDKYYIRDGGSEEMQEEEMIELIDKASLLLSRSIGKTRKSLSTKETIPSAAKSKSKTSSSPNEQNVSLSSQHNFNRKRGLLDSLPIEKQKTKEQETLEKDDQPARKRPKLKKIKKKAS